jgi:hypothetical protein
MKGPAPDFAPSTGPTSGPGCQDQTCGSIRLRQRQFRDKDEALMRKCAAALKEKPAGEGGARLTLNSGARHNAGAPERRTVFTLCGAFANS